MKAVRKWQAYISLMRLNKPIGSFLLLWPTLWSLWIASRGFPPIKILMIFCLGVLIMRSAGCVINDIADRHYDKFVKRTQNRPLAIGIIRLPNALLLFFSLCLIGFALVLQLNIFTIMLSTIALILAAIYPFMKRFSSFPQVFLGAAFAWSVPMSFAAIQNALPAISWLIYFIAVIWPIAYDSIYALMDKEDDIQIGIKSTVILFGSWDLFIIVTLQILVLLSLILLGLLLKFHLVFYWSIGLALGLLYYQAQLIRGRKPESYYAAFYNNHWLGATVFTGIFINYLL
jgi:4-hydroxybenzoate polyprenyltransferase